MALDLMVAMQCTGRLCSLLAGCISHSIAASEAYTDRMCGLYTGVGLHDILR